jgi:hypothetical protein
MLKKSRKLKTERTKRKVKIENDAPPPARWPDFTARAKKIFGNRILPGSDLLIKERGRY